MLRTCASLSITHGPAIKKSCPAPTCTGPTSKELLTKAILLRRTVDNQAVTASMLGCPRSRIWGPGKARNRQDAGLEWKSSLIPPAPRPLPKPALQRMERGRTGKILLCLHDPALGQPPAKGVVFHIKPHVVPRVPQGLQSAIIQHRIALRVDRGQNRGGDGNIHATQGGEGLHGVFGLGLRRSGYRQGAPDVLTAVRNQVMNHPFRLPAHDCL